MMYHGTTAENIVAIMRDGVRAGSFWTPYLQSAMTMGGPYVVAAHLDEVDAEQLVGAGDWEYVASEAVPPSRFILVYKLDAELLLYNRNAQRRLRKHYAEKDGRPWCEHCDGHGEMTYIDDGHWFLPGRAKFDSPGSRINDELVPCPVCRGDG